MNSESFEYFAVYTVLAFAVTLFLRSLPFLFFSKRPMPRWMEQLGQILPGAIIAVLVVYCLKDVSDDWLQIGIPKILGVLVTAVLYQYKKQSWLAIIGGTACFMALTAFIA